MERGTTATAVHTHRQYPTNVTEAQWQLLIPLLPKRNGNICISIHICQGLQCELERIFRT